MTDLVDRSAFLYLEPAAKADKSYFAQCANCRLFVPEKAMGKPQGRCVIHGSFVDVDEDDSCGFFVPWATENGKPVGAIVAQHAEELKKGIEGSVTTAESGFVDRMVQCRRCKFAKKEATRCDLFETLNQRVPEMFLLNPNIEPTACCNAQTPVEEKRAARSAVRAARSK